MFNLKVLNRILITTLKWAIVWGLAGAAMGVVATLIEPDTGHIPRKLVPVMIGLPSAAFGAVAGLLFASVLVPAHISASLGPTGRVVLGGVVGGAVGMIFMNLLAHSVVTVLLAAFLGAALAARFARPESLAEKK
jgi:hypothetical protein